MASVTPRGYRRRRRKQWWKSFTSPTLMFIGGPALLVPLATLIILQSAPAPLTPVELAVSELPTSGAGIVSNADAGAPFGGSGQRLSVSTAMPLHAGSARVETARLTMRESEDAVRGGDVDYRDASFALLHPNALAFDNFLIGSTALIANNPGEADIGEQLFAEYCAATPSDAFYNVKPSSLPISEGALQIAASWSALPGSTGHCPVRPG